MKLLIDLDGCIFPTYQELNVLHKALFQKEINWQALPDPSHPYWQTKQGQWVFKMFSDEIFYADLLAYKGARETLRIWMRESTNSITYCTARPTVLESATAYSIGRNNLPYGDMIFVKRNEGVAKNKLEVAQMENIDIAIDDESEIMLELKDTCITLIYTQPYNKMYPYDFRVNDWLEIHRILNTIFKGGE